MSDITRRDAVRRLALALTAAGFLDRVAAEEVHALTSQAAAANGGSYTPKTFTPAQFKTLERLADIIIPVEDGKPGALAAACPAWIDMISSENEQLKAGYAKGFAWLDEAMKKRGAKPGDLIALLAATGAQTETIPPSLVLITIGSVTGVSIAALFTGGLLPGVVLAITLCSLVWWRYRGEDLSHVKKAGIGQIARTFIVALPALALPFVIRAAVVEGVATATEVSTIGIVYAVLAGLLLYRQFDWRRLLPMLIDTACLSGAILLIIGTATGMAWGLTQSGFSRALAAAMTGLPGGSATFIAVSIVAFTILGSVLEGIPAVVLFGPLLFPIAKAVGVHEVHYAMIIILAMGMGLFAPPFGVGYYAACAIGRVDPAEGIRPIWGYMLALLVGLIIVASFPWISIGFLK